MKNLSAVLLLLILPIINYCQIANSTISGKVYNDYNENGMLDPYEPGLAGWEISLHVHSGTITSSYGNVDIYTPVATKITSTNGDYSFDNLSGWNYRVFETPVYGWIRTSPAAQDYIQIETFPPGNFTDKNFGNVVDNIQIKGRVFNDLNCNAVRDENEPGLSNWEVHFMMGTVPVTMSTTIYTDVNGFYNYSGISGTYNWNVNAPPGWVKRYPDDYYIADLSRGSVLENQNFAYSSTAYIYGNTFDDKVMDGSLTVDDMVMPIGNISLFSGGVELMTTTPDADGNWFFSGVSPGTYIIRQNLPPGRFLTLPSDEYYEISLSAGQRQELFFGSSAYGSISGAVFHDLNINSARDLGEPALAGWTINLTGSATGTAVSDIYGEFKFDNLKPGTYSLSEVRQLDWAQTAPAGLTHNIALFSGENIQNLEFGNFYTKGSVEGYCRHDANKNGVFDYEDPPLAGWEIILTNSSGADQITYTDSEGKYSFSAISAGSYTIHEIPAPNWVLTLPASPGTYTILITEGIAITGKNFLNVPASGKISGQKYNDLNGDGHKQQDEPGLQDWTIILKKPTGEELTSLTDNNGNFYFDNVAPGSYTLSEQNQTGWIQTEPNNPDQYSITINNNDDLRGYVFGNIQDLIQIKGKVFNDVNCNGILDSGEPGLSGWEINFIMTGAGITGSMSAHTNSEGYYTFCGSSGEYTWDQSLKPGWERTFPSAIPYSANLTAGTILDGKDFGNSATGFISGHQYNDTNGDGARGSQDTLRNYGSITLLKNGILIQSIIPTSDGYFEFGNLPPGNYSIRQNLSDSRYSTQPASGEYLLSVTAGTAYNLEFGSSGYGRIAGLKFNDLDGNGLKDAGEPVIPGWTIRLSYQNETGGQSSINFVTDQNGAYNFTNLKPGNYTVSEINQQNWQQTAPAGLIYSVQLKSGQSVSSLDFGNMYSKGSVGGKTYNDLNGNGINDSGEPGLSGWEIILTNASGVTQTTITDASGNYNFQDITPGAYTIQETIRAGWRLTFPPFPGKHNVVITAGQTLSGKDFANTVDLSSISGLKYEDYNGNGQKDPNEPGLPGWSIMLRKATGQESITVTDNGGNFYFANLDAGTYTLSEEQKTGWVKTQPFNDEYSILINPGDQLTGYLFGNTAYGSISGIKFNDKNANKLRDAGESVLKEWTIILIKGEDTLSMQTDTNGRFKFSDLLPGSYTAAEIQKQDWIQTAPEGLIYNLVLTSGQNINNLEFGNMYNKGTIEGRCFHDLNDNGAFDTDEPALQGMEINLNNNSGAEMRTVTDAQGQYCFTDLPPDTYTISQTIPAGWRITTPAAPHLHTVVLSPGTSVSAKDFGVILALCRVCGNKYNDLNGNGEKDSGEPGLSNWSIVLKKASGEEIITTTVINGNFCFTDIMPGTYTLYEIQQQGWTQTQPANSGDYIITLNTDDDLSGYSFGNRRQLGGLSGYVYYDKNRNAVFDHDEKGIEGCEIKLSLTQANVDTFTDQQGYYEFGDLPFGTYKVSENILNGWYQSEPGTSGVYDVLIHDYNYVTNLNFGNYVKIDSSLQIPSDLIGWWTFDEQSDIISYDLSTYSNNGKHKNEPVPIKAVVSFGLKFDGVDDFVLIPHNPVLNIDQDFSIDAWIKSYGGQGRKRIIEKTAAWGNNPGYSLYLEDGRLCYYISNGAVTINECSAVVINDNTWHHVALTFERQNSNCIKLYVDGILVKKDILNELTGQVNNVKDLVIGSSSFENSGYFKGVIDELDLFGSVLPEEYILSLWAADSLGKRKPISGSNSQEYSIPQKYLLYQCYPNPFNPTTLIRYELPQAGEVSLIVYDLLGREVRTLFKGFRQAGTYYHTFEADGLTSGVYIYKLQTHDFSDIKKLILLR